MSIFTKLDDSVLQLMGPGVVEQFPQGKINSLDFHRTHDLLVTSSDDHVIRIYNTTTGQKQHQCESKKYGVNTIRWTHAPTAVVYASTKVTPGQTPYDNHAVRYLDLHKGSFIRYFKGHSREVLHIDVSPKNDTFLTASTDRSVRIWDLRSNVCQAKLDTPAAAPCAAFDQQALIFAVALEAGIIKLYDVRNYTAGPFLTITVPQLKNTPSNFSQLQFSMDGQKFLAVCQGNVFVMDAFKGDFICQLHNGVPDGGAPRQATFSCDGNYVLSGCSDKAIRGWNATTGAEVCTWQGHVSAPSCIGWAPQRVLMASAAHDMIMWIPDVQKLQQLQQHPHVQQPMPGYQQQQPMQMPGVGGMQQPMGYVQQYPDPAAAYAYR